MLRVVLQIDVSSQKITFDNAERLRILILVPDAWVQSYHHHLQSVLSWADYLASSVSTKWS